MLSIGPVSVSVVIVVVALAAAIVAGALVSRRHEPGTTRRLASLIMDMTLVGFVAARAGFVLRWWSRYMENPWSIVTISDGGFLIWAGALVSTAFAVWRVRKTPALWRPLGTAVITGWAVWVIAGAGLTLAHRSQAGMPDTTLARLEGGTTKLAQVSDEPMVVNLWATWCGPCRREMPMLATAQQRHPGVTFVFVNQRQGRAAIRDYLGDENLQLNHVLIDKRGTVAQMAGSGALPTTLFYDTNGTLVATHVGMLTAATLAATLQQFDLPTSNHGDSK